MAPQLSSAKETLRTLALPRNITITQLASLAVIGVLAYGFILIIYRLYLHPLANVPGPKLWALSNIPYHNSSGITGEFVRRMVELHAQYGPIVRVGPDHVVYDGNVAWPDAWVQRRGKPEFNKQPGFFGPGTELSIIGAPDAASHRRQRRHLAPAFGDKSLQHHEPLITPYIDMFIAIMARMAANDEQIDIPRYLNYTTFDIIGDLSFQETFGCLASDAYHPWVHMLFSGIRAQSRMRIANDYAVLRLMAKLVMRMGPFRKQFDVVMLAIEKALARIRLGASPNGRNDFMTAMLKGGGGGDGDGDEAVEESKFGNLSMEEILATSSVLVAAGSETTATALSGMFFYMAMTPRAYGALAEEVRAAFSSEEEITMVSTNHLTYLKAVIEEGLRIFPAAPEMAPRVVPVGGSEVGKVYLPRGTLVHIVPYATFRNANHFAEPDSFWPERWLPVDHPLYDHRFDGDDRRALRPFSYGQRDCIGKNLAYAEMRVVLARFLYRFDYELVSGQEDWHDRMRCFMAWEKDALFIKVKARMV